MVLKRIYRSLSNDEGASTPMILGILLSVLIVAVMLFQYFYTTALLKTIRQSCSSVVEIALMSNADASYQAKRDGYTGVWHVDGADVNDVMVSIDPAASLAEQLGLISDGDVLVKMDGTEQVYRLSDIKLDIQNPEFQDNIAVLTATLSLTVDTTLKFPLIDGFPISVPVTASAEWNCKF